MYDTLQLAAPPIVIMQQGFGLADQASPAFAVASCDGLLVSFLPSDTTCMISHCLKSRNRYAVMSIMAGGSPKKDSMVVLPIVDVVRYYLIFPQHCGRTPSDC